MTMPVFLITLLAGGLSAASGILRDRGKSDVSPISLPAAIEEAKQLSRNWKQNPIGYVLDKLVSVLSGALVAALIAGIVGLLWTPVRWYVFGAILSLWLAASINVVIQDNVDASDRHRN
jgi:hypothetical protein